MHVEKFSGATRLRPVDIVASIIEHYEAYSDAFQHAEADRRGYFVTHPTFVFVSGCMDGRWVMPTITETPIGAVTKTVRAIGGKIELWWPALQDALNTILHMAVLHDAFVCGFFTSHYCSQSEVLGRSDLGCKGWHNDHEAARRHMRRICKALSHDYDGRFVAIPSAIDTATDNLTLYGSDEQQISGASLEGIALDEIYARIRRVFPRIPSKVIKDIAPFLEGNARRVVTVRQSPRSLEQLGHAESVLAIGEGFEGIAADNFAFMISPVDPNLDKAIVTAARLLEARLDVDPEQEFVIFTNTFYGNGRGRNPLHSLPATDRRCAVRRTEGLQRFAQRYVKQRCPKLWRSGKLRFVTGITHEPTRELQVVDQGRLGR